MSACVRARARSVVHSRVPLHYATRIETMLRATE